MSDGRLPVRRRWVGWTLGVAAVLLLVALGWVGVRGIGAVDALQHVRGSVGELRDAVAEGDRDAAERVVPRIQRHAAAAHELTSDPVWRGAEIVPWLGANLTAVREIAEITHDVAEDALAPLLVAAEEIDLADLGISGSRVDLTPFAAVEEPLARASAALSAAETRALRIDAGTTLPVLADAIREVRETVTEAARLVGAVHGASVLLPSMLGAEGPRDYVIAMQNNAELRSSGGIIGAIALLRAEDGELRLIRQASSADFPPRDEPLPLSASTTALFDDGPGRFLQNITSIPDFSEAGPLIAQRWTDRFGDAVDGVIAVDAVVAAHLLEATGPLTIGAFTLDADDAVDVLLSDVYRAVPDPAAQDAVFGQAAAALLGAALSQGVPRALLAALSTSAEEDRIRIWSAHDPEQALLARTTLGGGIPTDDPERGPSVGVLLNDTTGAKMDYYADARISTAVGVCRGEPTTQVRVIWTNRAPADAADALPAYVHGDGMYGVDPGHLRTLIAVYGPEGALLDSATFDGESVAVQTALLGTRSVVQHEVLLEPGASAEILVSFVGSGAGDRLTRTRHTPMIDDVDEGRHELDCGT